MMNKYVNNNNDKYVNNIHVYVNDIDFSCVLLLPVALLDHGSVCDINITFHPSVNILVFSETTGSNVTKLAEYLLLLHLYKVCCSKAYKHLFTNVQLINMIYQGDKGLIIF
jgi:hypothetical protein